MTKKPILQLILPVRNDPESKEKALLAENYYENRGFDVWNPHKLAEMVRNPDGQINESEAQGICIHYLASADAAILLPGWKNSEGCNLEITFASNNGIPLYYYKSNIRVYFNTNTEVKLKEHVPVEIANHEAGDIITPEVLYNE